MTRITLSSLDVVELSFKPMERGDDASAMALSSVGCDDVNPPPLGAVRGPAAVRGVRLSPFSPQRWKTKSKRREYRRPGLSSSSSASSTSPGVKWVERPETGVFEMLDGQITYWRDDFDLATILSEWPNA